MGKGSFGDSAFPCVGRNTLGIQARSLRASACCDYEIMRHYRNYSKCVSVLYCAERLEGTRL